MNGANQRPKERSSRRADNHTSTLKFAELTTDCVQRHPNTSLNLLWWARSPAGQPAQNEQTAEVGVSCDVLEDGIEHGIPSLNVC